jgi:hypothetical protein
LKCTVKRFLGLLERFVSVLRRAPFCEGRHVLVGKIFGIGPSPVLRPSH